MQAGAAFDGQTHIAETARQIMLGQLRIILEHEPQARIAADTVAVHEMRKAIRRTFTAHALFGEHLEPGLLVRPKRRLRKVMRRLGRSRDATVFCQKLQLFQESSGQPVDDLLAFWTSLQGERDDELKRYLARPRRRRFWPAYHQFLESFEVSFPVSVKPVWTSHLVPLMLQQRLTAVRAFEAHLAPVSLGRLHQLRIQLKELRYTLEFFMPLLSPAVEAPLETVKQLLTLLGDLNDAHVALEMLEQTTGRQDSVSLYRAAIVGEIEELLEAFRPLWGAFNSVAWRRPLALAAAAL